MRWVRHPLLILAVLACCAAVLALALAPHWTRHRFAADLEQRIVAAEDAEAVGLVAELAKLDAAALQALVRLLDDDRQALRTAAREALQQKLAAWTEEPSAASEGKLASLARALAQSPTPRDLPNRIFIKLTALKLLRQPLESDDVDRMEYLAHCSQILEKTLNAPPEPPAVSHARLEPQALPDSAELEPLPSFQEGPALEPEREEAELAPIVSSNGLERPRTLTIDDSEEFPVAPIDTGDQIDTEVLRSLSTRSLIRHLHGVPNLANAAERELRRRGLDDATLNLARALDDPRPEMRLQLVESLPNIEGIDATSWLWELAQDEHEAVRRASRNILATSSNPQTRARLKSLR